VQANAKQVKSTERELALNIRAIQNRYKFFALTLPPILPILLGVFVFIHRQLGEREGVSKTRLRYGSEEQAAA
jgi:hypothetical protein